MLRYQGRDTIILTTASNILNRNTFLLAAGTPVPMSFMVERQFYESQLLLFVLSRVQDDHLKRQNYYGELDQHTTELCRLLWISSAFIHHFSKRGPS